MPPNAYETDRRQTERPTSTGRAGLCRGKFGGDRPRSACLDRGVSADREPHVRDGRQRAPRVLTARRAGSTAGPRFLRLADERELVPREVVWGRLSAVPGRSD